MEGLAQKRKVSLADVKALETDPQPLKDLFAEATFDTKAFLDSMNKTELTEYLHALEAKRTIANQISSTVDRVPSLTKLKDQISKHGLMVEA